MQTEHGIELCDEIVGKLVDSFVGIKRHLLLLSLIFEV